MVFNIKKIRISNKKIDLKADMYLKLKLFKAIKKFGKKLCQRIFTIKKPIIWLLRNLFITKRRRESANAGFVLPTVAMVALVVVLLTTAILVRSFERSQNASNVRVNETVLNAATPAIDRARAKLNKVFEDGIPPTDDALETKFTSNINEYTLGDETQLTLNQGSTQLKTAWMYPVDTDNNGKFDSYTLYGIYFRNPPISNGQVNRARNPLEARTPPMTSGNVDFDCGDTLVDNTGWFKIGGKLKKSFFVYTANVPIASNKTGNYEPYKGNRGFSAIEYQQDRVQLLNAVIYEDDLELTPDAAFRLNGRIFTNSNLLTGSPTSSVKLYQVSSKASCFYEADNAKIVVGGNLGAGGFTDANDLGNVTKVHLFRKGETTDPVEVDFAKSTSPTSGEANLIAYNSLAYVQRINRLVSAQMANAASTDPSEVTAGIQKEKDKDKEKKKLGLSSYTPDEEAQLRIQQLQLYFQKRTRRVPYKEVAFGVNALGTYATNSPLQGSGDTLRPPDAWIYPTDPTNGKTGANYTNLIFNISADKLIPGATEPTKLQKDFGGKEQYLGDRALIGNNLPQLWWDSSINNNQFVGQNPQDTQNISGINWDIPTASPVTRTRRSRLKTLADLGSTNRDKDWELAAASPQDPVGGLRVVTGAGIYLPKGYTPASTDFSSASKEIWSDMMPVNPPATPIQPYSMYDSSITFTSPPRADNTPYLQMRATAVYHYKATGYKAATPTPIACVSSYYDPTNKDTARNTTSFKSLDLKSLDLKSLDLTDSKYDVSPFSSSDRQGSRTLAANSHNGIVYGSPTKSVTDYQTVLTYLSELKYPNGRLIDDGLLARALAKTAANRTLSEQSAIDAQICALQIKFDPTFRPTNAVIPHGAIQEIAFLDARQIKAIQTNNTTTDYDLAKKDRQPLEIRATVLDIDKLRTTAIGETSPAQEYLLPNSGIIYATRNDALLDLSAVADANNPTEAQKLESPVDYKLDPTRRPNAIMLVNGSKIGRGTSNNYRDVEKGLILATNLPVYIKGDFNKHTQEEFTTPLTDDWSNFYTRTKDTRNPNFACRPSDPRLPNCTTGDEWRPASVLADSITLLSNNFRLGFRNEGEYDLNNNLGTINSSNPRPSGYEFNAYAPTATDSYDSDGNPKDLDPNTSGFQGSSYLNNFVTPLVRQIPSGYYLTEVCTTQPCSNPFKWTIKTACGNGDGNNIWDGKIIGKNGNPNNNRLKTGYVGDPPDSCLNPIYGVRMALERNAITGKLIQPLSVLAVDAKGDVQSFPLGSKTSRAGTNLMPATPPRLIPLFKAPIVNGQEVFQPVLQLDTPFSSSDTSLIRPGNHNNWLQIATETTFNLVAAAGDTPARPTEDNGGLHNFVRFLENWNPTGTTNDAIKARISGSFIQVKRSAYATAPFNTSTSTQSNNYQYPIQGNNSRTPFYLAPTRQWGYDVGLLSQSPDLFAQKLAITPDDLPDEYFREVGRDDTWVQTLLCAKKASDNGTFVNAIDNDQRPDDSTCNK